CGTEGALIGWTDDPPCDDERELTLQERISGDPEPDGRVWRIYTAPLPPSTARRWARAWRLGHRGSAVVEIP
ncbi:hypothetical protein, partial [Promicromonospora panici]|uniref:hypothetical protein n=1 Tax=Promicromonospora panici TaxID=2219658 RepID=UPI001A90F19D